MSRPSAVVSVVDVDAVLDSARCRGVSLVAAVCTFSALMLDGLDIQVMGVAAPAVIAEFSVSPGKLGPVLAAALVGMALGSFIGGPAGDRWGRRPGLLGSMILFGAATLLSAAASSVETLAAWRFVTGIGLGAALPNATALIAEFVPLRWRSLAVTAAIAGAPLGGMLGAALAAEIVSNLGWRSIFVVGGLLPTLAVIPLYFLLPESARFLATRPGRRAELAALLNRIEGRARFSGSETFVYEVDVRTDAGPRPLFSREFQRDTLAAWVVFAAINFAMYAFANWVPAVLSAVGFELATAIRGALVYNFAGMIGALANAWVIARLGSRLPLGALSVVAIGALLYLSHVMAGSDPSGPQRAGAIVMAGIAVAGFGVTAVQLGMYAVVAHIYPTECRSSGVGWALGAGRMGGILSSLVGGTLLALGSGSGFFTGIAIAMVLALAGVLALRRHMPAAGRQLQQLPTTTIGYKRGV